MYDNTRTACVRSKHDDQDDDKMNTLAFVKLLLVKFFPTLIRQKIPPSKFCAIRYMCIYYRKHVATWFYSYAFLIIYNVHHTHLCTISTYALFSPSIDLIHLITPYWIPGDLPNSTTEPVSNVCSEVEGLDSLLDFLTCGCLFDAKVIKV